MSHRQQLGEAERRALREYGGCIIIVLLVTIVGTVVVFKFLDRWMNP